MNKNNVQLLGCIGVWMSGACRNVSMINCSGITGNSAMNGRTYINGKGTELGRVLRNGWATLDSTNASAVSPYIIDGDDMGNKFKVDTSGGDVYVLLDLQALKGETINLKITDATNDVVIDSTDGTGTLDGNAMPYTISGLVQYENYPISSDGTNLFIL